MFLLLPRAGWPHALHLSPLVCILGHLGQCSSYRYLAQAGAGRTAALGSITSSLTYKDGGRGGGAGGPANGGAAKWERDGGKAGGGARTADGCRVVVVTSLTHRAGMLQWADKQSTAR